MCVIAGVVQNWAMEKVAVVRTPRTRYVKFLPFGRFLLVKRHKFYTLGRSRYTIYM